MGIRRREDLKDWPPPPYYPGCISLTFVLHIGGELVEGPLTVYRGGYELVYDNVNSKGIDFWTLSYFLRDEEVCGDEVEYYIREDGGFKLISDDQQLKEIAGQYVQRRILHIYVVNCEGTSLDECTSESEPEFSSEEDIGSVAADEGNADEGVEGDNEGTGVGSTVDVVVDHEMGAGLDVNLGVEAELHEEDGFGAYNHEWPFHGSEFEAGDQMDIRAAVSNDEDDGEEVNEEDTNMEMRVADDLFIESDYEGDDVVSGDEGEAGFQTQTAREVASQDDFDEGAKSDDDMVIAREDFDERLVDDLKNDGKSKAPVFNSSEIYKPVITLQMLFATRDEFKKAVRSLAIRDRRQIQFSKTAPTRVYAKCLAEDCGWRICAHKVKNEASLQVTRFLSTHSCTETSEVPAMNSKWLAERFLKKFISDPKRSAEGFRLDVINKLKVNVTRHQAIAAKKRALLALHGSSEYQFSRLWDYAEELRTRNPGSTIIVGTKTEGGETRFDRFYACFAALKNGWRHGCRPLLGVDGCHLTGPHRGILLTAVGVDPNNALYPIAYAIIPIENRDNWQWFLEILKQDLQLQHVPHLTFISDRQKGLIQAMQDVFPGVDHRFCVRHMHNNFCTAGYRGTALKNLLWSAARSGTVPEFMHQMKKIREYSEGAWKWLNERAATQWSKSHFSEGPTCDMLLNNLCESFNSCIKEARDKTILTSLEWIREYIMKRHANNMDMASIKWSNKLICPMIEKIIQKNRNKVGNCIPIKSSDRHYQIRMMEGDGQYVVDLAKRECSCRLWQLNGYPCLHGLSAISHQRLDPIQYVEKCYFVATYKKAYKHPILGISSEMFWQKTPYIPPCPPNYLRGVGRPRKNRRLGVDEPKKKPRTQRRYTTDPTKMTRRQTTARCSNCGKEGHRITTCPDFSAEMREERRLAKARRTNTADGAETSTVVAKKTRVHRSKKTATTQQPSGTNNPRPSANPTPNDTPTEALILPPSSPPLTNPDEELYDEPVITQDQAVDPPPMVPGPSMNQQMLGQGPLKAKEPAPYTGGSWRAPQFKVGKKGPPTHNLKPRRDDGSGDN